MSGKILREKLLHGETVFGTLIQHTVCPSIVDFIPEGFLDFLIVTAEHTSLDLADFMALRYALAAKGIACLARTHSRDAADVAKVADSFDGVVVPYVEEVDECRQLAAAALYRPLKGERLNQAITNNVWPSEATRKSIEKKNEGTVFVPMIESIPAIENLDQICAIPGVHAVFVGPGDLTVNMGIPRKYDHPDLVQAVQQVIDIANMHHVAAGCWFGDIDQVNRTIRQGARFVVHSNDGLFIQKIIERDFGVLRSR